MLKTLWKGSAPLTATGLLMIAALLVALAGLTLDPRIITGAPAWLKPAKFAVSIAIYTFTLAWIFTLIPEWVRTRRTVGWMTAVAMIVEVVIIDLQAFRGTTSHFNVGTAVDGVLFGIMGLAIVVQTLSSIAVAVALWRHRFEDAALGWALRLGMIITIVRSHDRRTHDPAYASAIGCRSRRRDDDSCRRAHRRRAGRRTGPARHRVEHGAWRSASAALSRPALALQALPLLALVLARRRLSDVVRVRFTLIAAVSYFGLFGILVWQALSGQSMLAPDTLTITLFGVLVFATAAAAATAVLRPQPARTPALA